MLPSGAEGSMQIPDWDDTHQLLLSPQSRESVLQFCNLLPETEIQGMHTLQHTGATLQYAFSVHSRLLSSLISGVDINFLFFFFFNFAHLSSLIAWHQGDQCAFLKTQLLALSRDFHF